VLDLCFRGVWAISLGVTSPSVAFSSNPMYTIAFVTEIIRRFIWNIFRLENEHLKNCQHSNAIALPSLLDTWSSMQPHMTQLGDSSSTVATDSVDARASPYMRDYEEEEEGDGEVVMNKAEQEVLDQVTTGMRQRRVTIIDNEPDAS